MRSLRRLFILFLAASVSCLTAVAATNTTLTVIAAGNPVTSVASGTVVTLTAQVNAGVVTTGLVNFCDATAAHCTDVHILGSAQLTSAGLAVFSFVPGIGAHSYNAVFVGTSSNAGSVSNMASLTVTGLYPTTTSIAQLSGEQGNYTIAATLTGIDFTTAPTGSLALLDTSNNNASIAAMPLGTLTPGATFITQGIPNSLDANATQAIVAGDFNGDGKPDVAIANGNNTVSVLLGKGDGTFTAGSNPATSNTPVAMVVADFNGDGKLDLATVNSDSSITVLLGNGDGTFTAAASQQSVAGDFLAVADVNGDGIPDLIVAGSSPAQTVGPFTITTLLGKGDGTFSTGSQNFGELGGSVYIALADFNGDGKQDIAVTGASPSNNPNAFNGVIAILLGNGDGTFSAGSFTAQVTGIPTSIAVADFNLDGKPDVVVETIDQPVILTGYVGEALVLLGNGDGTFTTAKGGALSGPASWIAVADFNQDGKPDISLALGGGQAFGTDGVNVDYGNGDGTFTAGPSPSFTPDVQGQVFTTADFNGDGFPDLGALGTNGSATLLYELTETANVSFSNLDPAGTGTHQIEGSYPGDSNYNPSLSSTVALVFGNPVIVVSPITLPAATATVPYTQTLTATGGTPPYHYQIPSGTPPFGLTLTTAGVLSGTIAAGGIVSFNVAVTDSTAGTPNSTSITYALNVLPLAVFVDPALLPNGTVGVAYNQALKACCGSTPYNFTQQCLPAGLSMSRAGVISGTPTASGTFNVAVSVSEATANSTLFGYATYTLTIAPAPPTFTFAAGSATSATVTAGANATYPFSLTGLNGFNAAVNLSCSGLPNEAACSFSPSSPITPSGTAAVNITLTVSTSEPATSSNVTSLHRRAFDTFGRIFSAASLAALFLIRMPRRFRDRSRVLRIAILGILSVGMLSSCGGGNSNHTMPAQSLTPAGTYTFKVTATQQGATVPVSQATQLTLIVD